MWSKLCATLVAGLVSAVSVSAATYNVQSQNDYLFRDSNGLGSGTWGFSSIWDGAAAHVALLYAGALQLRADAEGGAAQFDPVVAYSTEMYVSYGMTPTTSVAYEDHPSGISSARQTLVATLFQEAYDPTAGAVHHGAFQLALWKLLHGSIDGAGADAFDLQAFSPVGAGAVSFGLRFSGLPLSSSFDTFFPGLFGLAQSWLDQLDGQGTDWVLVGDIEDHVTFLSSDTSRNLVLAAGQLTPVTLPASAAGALLGLAVLVGLRALRRSQSVVGGA